MQAQQPPESIGRRLAQTAQMRFVGRRAELAQFEAALQEPSPPFAVLHVHGVGGVGKSTLLREFARLAKDAGRALIALDGRDVQASRQEFLRAFAEACSDAPDGKLSLAAAGAVVLIDTYEALHALDGWLRESFLPHLPARTLVVLAGRNVPALAWRTDVAWAPLARIIELGNLSTEDSADLLQARGLERPAQAEALAFAHGHPLALALVADLLAAEPDAVRLRPGEAHEVVEILLGLFLDSLPSGRQRDALEVCVVARVTNEPLLNEMLGVEEGRGAFAWLRSLSFIERSPLGVYPHDLAREVLLADARWRDEEGLRRLARRVYSSLLAKVRAAAPRERQRLQMDALYVTRTKPTNLAFFDWNALGEARIEPIEGDDAQWIESVVARHEGPASAALARAWLESQPAAFQVFRDANEARFGFLALLDIGPAASPGPADPAIDAARAFVQRHAPVARHEAVVHLRWWMHAETYQAITAAINLTAMHVVSHCLSRPGVAWNWVTMAEPAFWTEHFAGVNFARVPEADFEVGGRRYGVFAHEWRIESPADWLSAQRVPMPFGEGVAASTALAQPEFQAAVRDCLRHFSRPALLAASVLLNTRLAGSAATAPERIEHLRRELQEAARQLQVDPRDGKLHRAIWHTYFEPLATQEAVAERLGLPFSTYRHHLARAIDRIVATLWRRERSVERS